MDVYVSTVIQKPIDEVWAKIRDFNGLAGWMAGILACEIEGGRASDAVGAVRRMTIPNGGQVREQLLALSDVEHSLTYAVLEGPLPVASLVATMTLKPITTEAGATFGEWTARFVAHEGKEQAARELLGKVFGAGWRGLKKSLGAG